MKKVGLMKSKQTKTKKRITSRGSELKKKKIQISLLFNEICLEYLCKTKYNQNKSKNKLSLNNGPTFFFGLLTYPYSSLRELGVDNTSVLFIRILCHSFCFHQVTIKL